MNECAAAGAKLERKASCPTSASRRKTIESPTHEIEETEEAEDGSGQGGVNHNK